MFNASIQPVGALLSVSQVAAQLGVSTSTVRRLVRDGRLPTVHIGRAVRIPASAVQQLIASAEATVAMPGPKADPGPS